jgi:hypothetical protein
MISVEADVRADLPGRRRSRIEGFAVALLAGLSAPLGAQAGAVPPGASPVAHAGADVVGALVDSIHGGSLAGATVTVVGTSFRTSSIADGTFRLDGIPPGTYTLAVSHPLLDTLGVEITSRPIVLVEGRVLVIGLATPSSSSVRRGVCPRADTVLAPGLLVGRLRDADTDAPAAAAQVSLVYPELQVSAAAGVHRISRVRRATVAADGRYAICGLPAKFRGTIQATRGADATAEVAVTLKDGFLALRSLTIGSASIARGDEPSRPAGTAARQSGLAALSGRVVNAAGEPVAGAQAEVTDAAVSSATSERGEFSLRSLPSGTRELVIRKVGYESAVLPVELTRREPRKVVVTLVALAPTLPTVQVKASMQDGLKRAGFFDRKAMGMGYYVSPEMIDSIRPRALSDLLNTAPGIQVTTTDWGTVVQSTRSVAAQKDACVNLFVDRAPWTSIHPGDLDTAFPVADIVAVEVYGGNSVPSEFTMIGKSCATIVVWTRTSVGKP